MPKLLTKSKYLVGLQCAGYMWDLFHNPEKIPKPDKAQQYVFDQGTIIGQLATKAFPYGIAIPESNFMENIRKSKKLLLKRVPLFEAAFMIDGIYSRADVLKPAGKNQWDIIEVKSGTKVKDVNVHDVSFQKHCYEKAGLKIRKCFLMTLNNEYIRKGKIDVNKLFKQTDITEKVEKFSEGIETRIAELKKVIASKKRPTVPISHNCKKPYECPLKKDCWSSLPEGNVFELSRGGKKSHDLFDQGIVLIKDIPKEVDLTLNQGLQHQCACTGKPHICKESISKFLNKLKYPLYYLDFETFNPAIPLYNGTHPYQRIPFQFSLHIVQENGATEHISFLAEGQSDPRKKFLKALKSSLGTEGSIIVFYQIFEQGLMKELATSFPEYLNWVASLDNRWLDLFKPFKNFHYYHPKQKGSASIKKVLPAVTGKGYDGMYIADGMTASIKYAEAEFGACSQTERKKVRKALEKYCGLDTEGMIWIIDELKRFKIDE
ncbi:DUF2779 domain-containing protein [Candidatus Woesearchaeota archaeon]|jgi:hypothetical protein|nr:DUF2779 domain-containing protein [Candidatus Woesearchaeota archaeon]MBT7402385.1 DUF2779 domain-containing protein [Candidatus Woesearchaeota archaeon]